MISTSNWGGFRALKPKPCDLLPKNLIQTNIFDLNIPNCEDMWIQLDLGNNKKCIAGVIYRHPKQKLSEFCKSFESTIEKLNSRKLMYYIGGDFNADLLKSNSDINIKDFMNLTYSLGCIPLITHPTRITTTSSTLLDHVYTNNVVGEHKSFILVEDVSDHLPVMVCSIYQQCSSNYRNHSCIFMLEFNNNLFYCLNSMSLVHSSITLLLQYVISHFDVPLNY